MELKPKWIALEVTRKCNLRCIHCRSGSEAEVEGHPDFSTKEAFRIIDDVASYTKPVVVLSGGEPMLRKDIFDIAGYGAEKDLRMALATNGVFVTEDTCEKIKESDIKIVSLSLDGSTAEVHDDFRRQEGAFAGTINAAQLLKRHNIEFVINSSFTKRNQEAIPATYRLAKELGATAWYMFMVIPTGRGEELMGELISSDDYEDILEWHYEMEKDEDDLLVRPACAPHYFRIILEKAKASGSKLDKRPFKFAPSSSKGCVVGQVICVVDVDGNVLPCSYFPKAAGNLREQSLKDIWEGSELLEELRDIGRYKGKCGKCKYVTICGGCRARAYSIHGDYLREDSFCGYIPSTPVHVRRCS
ncbi:MAG: radical SAM protein [Actinobacteria bacterium]|nr:radical SAM protein [Actinomycetota bacterium]